MTIHIKSHTLVPNQAAADGLPEAGGGAWAADPASAPLLSLKFNGDPKSIAAAAQNVGEAVEQALRESREELRRLSGLLISIQEDERRRIAQDLHDGLGQSISLIKLGIEKSAALLDVGATREAGAALRRLVPQVEEALAEVRRVSTELRPSLLDDLGILPTLSWFFREFQTVCGGGIVVESALNVAEQDIPSSLHITLYRILQEAVHNIVKHAAADRVRVRLARDDAALCMVIEDNGRGFDPRSIRWMEGQTRGLGLLSMKERASFSGGRFQLDSAPGKGTRIHVSWPAGNCPASLDCCRECGSARHSCLPAMKAAQPGDPTDKVLCIQTGRELHHEQETPHLHR